MLTLTGVHKQNFNHDRDPNTLTAQGRKQLHFTPNFIQHSPAASKNRQNDKHNQFGAFDH